MNELRPRNLDDYKMEWHLFFNQMHRCKHERHENFFLASPSIIWHLLDGCTFEMFDAYDHTRPFIVPKETTQ